MTQVLVTHTRFRMTIAALGCLLGMAAMPAHAQSPAPAAAPAAPAPDWTNTGNASIVSDYVFRGVSQSQGKPTGQATLDFTHVSGAYVGLFGSGVSYAAYPHGSRYEIDVYGGYRLGLGADSNVDMGLVTYWYPGAHYTVGTRDVTFHTQDLKIGLNRGSFNTYGWLTVSRNWFGFGVDPATGNYADSRGTTYFEANWNPELASGLVLNMHGGRQIIRNFSGYDFYDMKIGVTKTWDNWAVSGGVSHNSGDAAKNGLPYWTFFNADGSSKNVVGTRLQLSAGRNF